MSTQELYESTIRQLPALDRLRLASLILDELAATSGSGLDLRDDWSDEDVRDLAAFSVKHAASAVGNEGDHG